MSSLGLGRVLSLVAAGTALGLLFVVGCGSSSDSPAPANGGTDVDAGPTGSGDAGADAEPTDSDGGAITLGGPIAKLAGGLRHSCVVYANGALGCWGGNDNGQLGLGDTTDRGDSANPVSTMPAVDLGAGVRVAEVALGDRHTCARLTTGNVKCWGSSDQGQTGMDANVKRGDGPGEMGASLPDVNLGAGRTATQITAGGAHTCALLDNAQIKCWGRNASGQLGQGDSQNRGETAGDMAALQPIDVGAGRTAVEVRAGDASTCARLSDGSVRCWGANPNGELGIGNTDVRGNKAGHMGDSLLPVLLGAGRTATALYVGGSHACAKLDDGSFKCWGKNNAGQLGLGDTAERGTAAAQMGDLLPVVGFGAGKTVAAMSLGAEFGCVRLEDGAVKCWGAAASGQTGYGSTQRLGDGANEMGDNLAPVALGEGRTAKELAVGREHACAVIDTGKVKCWGANVSAQLGNGNRNSVGAAANQMGSNLADTPLP